MFKIPFTCNSLSVMDIFRMLFYRIFGNPKKANEKVIRKLSEIFQISADSIFLTGAGRMGLYLFLKALNLKPSDEVIVAGFTCVVVTNAVKFAGLSVRYVDIDPETLNLDLEKLYQSVTPRTRVIIVPHNFGIIDENIPRIKSRYPDILVIEDAAHTFGSAYRNGKMVGTAGDAAFFSFEFSKPLTTGFGGLLLVNNPELLSSVQHAINQLNTFKKSESFKIIFYLLVLILKNSPFTSFAGNILYKIIYRMKLEPLKKYTEDELRGILPDQYPFRMPSYFKYILYLQIKRLEKINKTKRKISELYFKILKDLDSVGQFYQPDRIYVRYPLIFNQEISQNSIDLLKKRILNETTFIPGEWFNDVIHPAGSFRYGYEKGSCQSGENTVKTIMNLPVNINCIPGRKQLYKLKSIIREVLQTNRNE